MRKYTCDVLIVGGGPAGAMAGEITSRAHCKTIMLDRKSAIGTPVKCAEYIPIQLAGEVSLNKNCIAQSIAGMKTFIGGKLDDTNKARGYMIHRDIFDQSLVNTAISSGTTFMSNSDFIGLNSDGTALIRNRLNSSQFTISFKIMIGADGPASKVATSIGFPEANKIPGFQYTLPLLGQEDYTEIHFNKTIFGGYGWFFPKNDSVNIGLGINKQGGNQKSVKRLLDDFIEGFIKSKRVANKIIGNTCGWIPVSPRNSCVKGNVILAGDAGGHTHPITGAGIFAAVMCGKMAGKAAADSLEHQDLKRLSNYDNDWQSLFGKTLKRASQKRDFMENNWDDFENTIKQTWVAYKTYYKN